MTAELAPNVRPRLLARSLVFDELNEFMEGWVCPSMANGTTYFWFEAFDEPWKEMFNDAKTGDFWEPHWGLFDVDRNLKKGVRIPDCGGKTLTTPY